MDTLTVQRYVPMQLFLLRQKKAKKMMYGLKEAIRNKVKILYVYDKYYNDKKIRSKFLDYKGEIFLLDTELLTKIKFQLKNNFDINVISMTD